MADSQSFQYGLKEIQILINGDERYCSTREKYMKSSLFRGMNGEGFLLKVSCTKRTNLEIKSIRIIEYEKTVQK